MTPASSTDAVFSFASPFTDHAVLQCGRVNAVWGLAEPRALVGVELDHQQTETRADGSGRWRVTFDPLAAFGEPKDLRAHSGGQTLVCRDVLVGEVWLCGGQSNMEWPVLAATDSAAVVAAAHFPQIRLFKARKQADFEPRESVQGRWEVCSPATVGAFSAVAYAFGRELHRELGVPVGLVDASWGGSTIESWISPARLGGDHRLAAARTRLVQMKTKLERAQRTSRPVAFPGYHRDAGNRGQPLGWAEVDLDCRVWPAMTLPCLWQSCGLICNGVVWFRREVILSDALTGRDLELCLGKVDDFDTAYFNGVEVGRTEAPADTSYAVDRVYRVPGTLVRPGRNVIAVRVFDHYGHGGFSSGADQLRLRPAGADADALGLAGEWQYQVELALPPLAQDPTAMPGVLANGMIAPLAPFGLRGAIWYQGESNTHDPAGYRHALQALVEDWRQRWGEEDFAFLYVQLPNYEPADGASWAEFRLAQASAQNLPNTGMAVTIDLGQRDDIHPPEKWEVGRRLALLALRQTYGRRVVANGPRIARVHFVENRAEVELKADGSPLVVRGGGDIAGFELADVDGRFYPARAWLRDASLVVRADEVARPVSLRHAHANNPRISLYNEAGLPLAPGWYAAATADDEATASSETTRHPCGSQSALATATPSVSAGAALGDAPAGTRTSRERGGSGRAQAGKSAPQWADGAHQYQAGAQDSSPSRFGHRGDNLSDL